MRFIFKVSSEFDEYTKENRTRKRDEYAFLNDLNFYGENEPLPQKCRFKCKNRISRELTRDLFWDDEHGSLRSILDGPSYLF
jgi:hypothetical protein